MKIDGKRAYEIARNGQEAEIKAKTVEIKTFELTRIALPEVDFRVVCSKGTYIRSLARDLGVALGCGAHLTRLVRTRIGEYRVEDAFSLEAIEALRPPRPEGEAAPGAPHRAAPHGPQPGRPAVLCRPAGRCPGRQAPPERPIRPRHRPAETPE